MDTTENNPEPGPTTTVGVQKNDRNMLWVFIAIIVLGIIACFYVFSMEQTKASSVLNQNATLNAQVTTLNREVKAQNDINTGTIAPGSVYKDPAGGIGFVNGAVTFTLPSGWKRVPQNDCAGGTIDSTAVCEDVGAIAPSSMINSDGTAKWSATIGIYDYASTDGSARKWFEGIYYHNPLAGLGNPVAANISESPDNGYSALSFEYTATNPAPTPPDYTDAFFSVVHGSYAVVVSAQVQASTAYGNSHAFDYTTTYLPQLTKVMQTIKFR